MSGRHRGGDEPDDATERPASESTHAFPKVDLAARLAAVTPERAGRRRAPGPPDQPAAAGPGAPTPVAPGPTAPGPAAGGERVGRRRRSAPESEPSITDQSIVSSSAPSAPPAPPAPPPVLPPAEPDAAPAEAEPRTRRSPFASRRLAPAADDLEAADAGDDLDSNDPLAASRTLVTGARRAQQRHEEHRRKQRLRIALVGVVVLALIAGGTIAWRMLGDGSGTRTTSSATPERTMLLQLAGPDKKALDSAVLGVVDAKSSASVLLVPSRLVVEVAGAGSMGFGDVVSLPDPAQSRNALTDLIGLKISSSMVLRPNGLKSLVDRVGGVDVDVDTDVLSRAANGASAVLVPAGRQHLTGALAYAYASYSAAANEPDQSRLARFSDVLRGLLGKLPASPARVATLLTGIDATSTLPTDQTASLLAVLGQVDDAGSVAYDTLPVREIDTGSAAIVYGLDAQAADSLVRERFPQSAVSSGKGPVKVLVENGVGTPGLVNKARTKLVAGGFRFINGGNATQFTFTQTVVLIPDSSETKRTMGAKVAKALGVPVADVQLSTRGQTVADVIVILGKDFKP